LFESLSTATSWRCSLLDIGYFFQVFSASLWFMGFFEILRYVSASIWLYTWNTRRNMFFFFHILLSASFWHLILTDSIYSYKSLLHTFLKNTFPIKMAPKNYEVVFRGETRKNFQKSNTRRDFFLFYFYYLLSIISLPYKRIFWLLLSIL